MSGEWWDVAVIGGGPAGYTAAIRLAQKKWKVLLVEKDQVGGTCLNRGCIPSKALIHLARVKRKAETATPMGLSFAKGLVNWEMVQNWVQQVIGSLRSGLETILRNSGVVVERGIGDIIDEGRIQVEDGGGKRREVKCRAILLATGSVPAKPSFAPEGLVLTDEEGLFLPRLPSSLIVIGGGSTGVELAWLYASLGVSVTLLEMMPRLLPAADAEISDLLDRSFRRQGIKVLLSSRVTQVLPTHNGIEVRTESGETVTGSVVIGAVGRKPNPPQNAVSRLSLQEVSDLAPSRCYQWGQCLVVAAGDLLYGSGTAHGAIAEGVETARMLDQWLRFGQFPPYAAPAPVPYCAFCHPEVAGVGITEEAAYKQGRAITVGRFLIRASGPARIEGEGDGLIKVLADSKTGKILGIHMVGPYVTHLAGEASVLVSQGLTVEEGLKAVRIHPSWSEGIGEALWAALGEPLHSLHLGRR
ncbi:MAG: FAD-dependent oxidoreductase [Armatimonadetes bacterium]|nr:FAD-dependent oxidoreductase [Armatimonadota bacterium]MDW8121834.1 FAD-dependent oxidoreductase [Armatimonadota bacterium]